MLYSEDEWKKKRALDYRAEQLAAEWAQAVRRAADSGLLTVVEVAVSHPGLPLMYCLPGQSCWQDVHRSQPLG